MAFRNRGFTSCLILLACVAVSFQLIGRLTGWGIGKPKLPVPLRKPLKQLDRAKLRPYTLVPGGAVDIKPEILDSLGTREYISWTLQDESLIDKNVPEAIVNFFVTYYTDDPGQVPHVPEECYSGGGHVLAGDDPITIDIPELGQKVDFKLLTFEKSSIIERDSRIVLYAFHVNGRFARDRATVRKTLIDPLGDKHAYFSKVEISFGGKAQPSREKAIEAGTRFLQKALPVLVNDHWPDWEEVRKMEAAEASAKSK